MGKITYGQPKIFFYNKKTSKFQGRPISLKKLTMTCPYTKNPCMGRLITEKSSVTLKDTFSLRTKFFKDLGRIFPQRILYYITWRGAFLEAILFIFFTKSVRKQNSCPEKNFLTYWEILFLKRKRFCLILEKSIEHFFLKKIVFRSLGRSFTEKYFSRSWPVFFYIYFKQKNNSVDVRKTFFLVSSGFFFLNQFSREALP